MENKRTQINKRFSYIALLFLGEHLLYFVGFFPSVFVGVA